MSHSTPSPSASPPSTAPLLLATAEPMVVRLAFAALGFVPIAALCIALFGIVPLHLTTRCLVAPAALLTMALAWRFPGWGRVALIGFSAGVLGTAAFDATRLTLVWFGLWPDAIPGIGRMALSDEQALPIWGYLWRFVGNGGGMGMAFAMLPRHGTRIGMLYGAGICCCLWITLYFGPEAQARLFPLNGATMVASMIGHLDYGAVLGLLAATWLKERPSPEAPQG